jgi:hypothetical protein
MAGAKEEIGQDDEFPTAISLDEANAGFVIGEVKNPKGHYGTPWGPQPPKKLRAAVRDLGNGRRAVKMLAPGGGEVYAIWNEKERPVDDIAHSLEDLLQRYPSPAPLR